MALATRGKSNKIEGRVHSIKKPVLPSGISLNSMEQKENGIRLTSTLHI